MAGEVTQFDLWFPPFSLPVGFGQTRPATQLPVRTMVCGYILAAAAVLIPSHTAEYLMAGWWQLIVGPGALLGVLVWDGEGTVGRLGRRTQGAHRRLSGLLRHLATKVLIYRPADPEAKPLVERLHDHLERSFLAG